MSKLPYPRGLGAVVAVALRNDRAGSWVNAAELLVLRRGRDERACDVGLATGPKHRDTARRARGERECKTLDLTSW